MGFWRILFTYLIHNEQLINKLANTKPIRRSAQFIAYLILQSRTHGISLPFNQEKFFERLKIAKYIKKKQNKTKTKKKQKKKRKKNRRE